MYGISTGALGMAATAHTARWHEYNTTTAVSATIERTSLRKLAAARIEPADTLVLAPARKLVPDTKTLRRLAALARAP